MLGRAQELQKHPEMLLMTDRPPFRPAFSHLDKLHHERAVLKATYKAHPHWPAKRIPALLARGNGLWIAGRSKLDSLRC